MNTAIYRLLFMGGLFLISIFIFWFFEWLYYKFFIEEGQWMKLE